MNHRIVTALAAGLVLTTVLPASAGIYKYKDRNGVLHVVDSPAKIPPEYRDQAPAGDVGGGQDSQGYQLQQAEPLVKPSAPQKPSVRKAAERSIECNRKLRAKQAEINDLRQKASVWTRDEWMRRCYDKAADGTCPVTPNLATRVEVMEAHKAIVDRDNPYLKQAESEEIRLKKMTQECR